MKIVINNCYGGFGLSKEAIHLYNRLSKGKVLDVKAKGYDIDKRDRDCPVLVQVVEQLGSEGASGFCADLRIVEIPDDVNWTIQEYDGYEWIAEAHRTWQYKEDEE